MRNSFVTLSTPEVPGDSDTSDSDIQPSGLQRFPRLTLEDPNSGSFFRIREPPSPQSTPSLPRRALSNQTLHLKQPVQPDTSTQTTNIEQQSHRQNSENSTSDQTSGELEGMSTNEYNLLLNYGLSPPREFIWRRENSFFHLIIWDINL